MKVQFGTSRVELVQGDISLQEIDAIVNAANSELAGGGGVFLDAGGLGDDAVADGEQVELLGWGAGDFQLVLQGLAQELAGPVREITVASTLQRILQSVVVIGADVEWLPGIAAGQTLAVGDMQVSGA